MPKPRLNCCAMLAMLVAVYICGWLDIGIAHRLGRGELQRLEEARDQQQQEDEAERRAR